MRRLSPLELTDIKACGPAGLGVLGIGFGKLVNFGGAEVVRIEPARLLWFARNI